MDGSISFRSSDDVLLQFENLQIPNLCIVTGLNGSGKTKLLSYIKSGIVEYSIDNFTIPSGRIFSFDMNSFDPFSFSNIESSQIYMHPRPSIAGLPPYERFFQKFFRDQKENEVNSQVLLDAMLIYNNLLREDVDYQNLIGKVDSGESRQVFSSLSKPIIDDLHNSLSKNLKNYYDLLVDKSLSEIVSKVDDSVIIDPDPANLEDEINKILLLLNLPYKIYGGEEYIKSNIHSRLRQINLKFKDNNHISQLNSVEFTIKFKHTSSNAIISLNDLSKGERAILSLISILFSQTQNLGGQRKFKPKLLLLDEPDAHLHPASAINLVEILREYIVDKMGINIIMSTHSPVTLTASSASSCLSIQSKMVSLVSIEEAVNKLMEGLPYLSIIDKSSVYIFTESLNDSDIYKSIYTVLKKDITFFRKPIFLPSGSGGGGNSELVSHIVKSLSDSTMFRGIIDWDLKSNPTEGIHVLAHEKRYTIENCLFDPFVIYIFLSARNRGFPEQVFRTEGQSTGDLIRDLDLAQRAVNQITTTVLGEISEAEYVQVAYYGNFSLNIRKDYLTFNGHDLEKILKIKIPSLKAFNNLKWEIATLFIDYPSIIPFDFVSLLNDILGDNGN